MNPRLDLRRTELAKALFKAWPGGRFRITVDDDQRFCVHWRGGPDVGEVADQLRHDGFHDAVSGLDWQASRTQILDL